MATMSATVRHAVRLGGARGLIEFRQRLTSPPDLFYTGFWAASFVVVLVLQRHLTLAGTGLPLARATLPGLLAVMVVSGGVLDIAGVLTVEREDGTLLRAKAVPQGMVGYLVARVVTASIETAAGVLVVLVAGLVVVPSAADAGWARWPALVAILALGLLAVLPWGAVVGSVAGSPGAVFGLAMLPVMAITAISGIFYPISALPGWMQSLGQLFPPYWLGLGTRSVLLPDAAVAAELGGSWRTATTIGVLGVWAAAGLLVAPVLLRRMARRESGADLQERGRRAMQRYT